VRSYRYFYEALELQEVFSADTIRQYLGVDVPDEMWDKIAAFPELFKDKVKVAQFTQHTKAMDAIESFVQKTFAIAAKSLGYGPSGVRMPKVKLSIHHADEDEYQKQDYAGQIMHNPDHSYGHAIDIGLKDIYWHDGRFQRYMYTLIHEIVHSRQITQRKLSISSPYHDVKWKGKGYNLDDEVHSTKEYEESPWEKEADVAAAKALKLVMNYLRSNNE